MSVTHTSLEPDLELSLVELHTHQNEFTRAYWIGWATAQASHHLRSGFHLRLPAAYLGDLQHVLPGRSLVEKAERECNSFGVWFAIVSVEPR